VNVAVIVPLKAGARDRATAILDHGPPFDPASSGLERHQAYVTEAEAVFLFEADAVEAVERLADDATLWDAVEGWTELVAGPPRLAEGVYSWTRPVTPESTFFTPLPGPGDSEGGDLYGPEGTE
jgi:hypothetical protein